MAVGHTEELDGEFAAAEIVEQCGEALGGLTPQAGWLLAAHDLDLEDFLQAINDAYPDIELVGCSTLASMSSASEFAEGSTTLTLFASDVLDFTTGLGRGVAQGVEIAARRAVEEAAAKTPKDPALVVITPTMEGLDPVAITKAMADVLGPDVPVFGGGAVPDFPMTAPWVGAVQFYGNEILTDTLPLLLISGPLKVSIGVAHGWRPVGKDAVVTRASGGTVYEIDGEPALDYYRRYLGVQGEPAGANPLAILDEQTGRYYLRAPMSYDPETGSADFLGSVPDGAKVHIAMATTEQILDGTDASLQQAIKGFPEASVPEGALVASCAVRNFLLGTRTRDEIERIRDTVGRDLPVSGFYAFGEIAPLGTADASNFHNETCVTVLLGT